MLNWIKSIIPGNGSESLSERTQYVLVVDDSEVERTFYRKTLKRAGYQVFAASNAQVAIDSLKNHKPDLIITDLSMPEMDGKEMCRRIKSDEATEKVPIIFLTGSAKMGEVVELFDAGGEHYLEKPIDGKTLIRQVENIFNDLAMEETTS